ncbi:hypothetical protein CPB83DRAFT_888675 [Crepidotus variabilis]|uniref:DH domain-containing protein n=1 Tax=Crepidotus variabilis TaxID=179855 RepID=A0A9P6ETN7_9AGAR|nr:hypothetical protein CPB83DRAFT_888675 [Crepidotus variabilis]
MSSNRPTITPCSTLLSRRISSSSAGLDGRSEGSEAVCVEQTTYASHHKLSIRGFLPLPSIAASPICTPTPSAISQLEHSETDAELDLTSSPLPFPPENPTWIATPPTPPQKHLRRSHSNTTRSIRQHSFTSFSAYSTFPAYMQQPHAVPSAAMKAVKRCSSVPAFPSTRLSQTHALFLSFMDAQIVESPQQISCSQENLFESAFSVFPGDDGPEDAQRNKRAGSELLPLTKEEIEAFRTFNNGESYSPIDPSPESSWSDHSVENSWETEKHKDTLRRFHALKEFLSTEMRYLMDLKSFVVVYLRNLPTTVVKSTNPTSAFGRASASFATGPWIYTTAQLQAAAPTTSTSSGDTQNAANPSTISMKPSRYVFSNHEIELLTRNAEDILRLHEHFVRELEVVLKPLGYAMDDDENHHDYEHLANLDTAIRIVSTKFATEASRFNAYQTFCAGHPEAMDVLRKASQQFPIELDTFEHRCSTTIATAEQGTQSLLSEPPLRSSRSSTDTPTIHTESLTIDAKDRKRAISLTSLDAGIKSIRTRSTVNIPKDSIAFPTQSTSKQDSKSSSVSPHRIAFADYLIKPIQRICKYPLLLDQLLPSKTIRSLSASTRHEGFAEDRARVDVEVVVESAAQAMRHVATLVDEARRKQDIAVQSGLILSRICAGLHLQLTSASPSALAITSEFLSSLGTCLLSGSLDVMHYSPDRPLGFTSNIKAKYLGAFLYSGAYLILVRVSKGKKYEPRHWFSLVDFEVTDVEDDSAMLPCSIRLSYGDHHFELAAACQKEKDSWLSSIHEALRKVPTWDKEPIPSFMFDEKGELIVSTSDDGHSEAHNNLPTIHSIPEMALHSDAETSEPFFASLRGHTKKKRRRYDSAVSMTPMNPKPLPELPQIPSRRSSTNSVKNIFGPPSSDVETVTITRSSPIARHQVDQELQDVISESCMNARSYAYSHEMELFQAPTQAGRRSSRTNSTIGMVRLSKHESVRVPRRRATDSSDGAASRNSVVLNDSFISGSKNFKRLTVSSIPFHSGDMSTSSQETPISTPCSSPPSSHSSSSRGSTLRTPVDVVPSSIHSIPVSTTSDQHTKHSRSFVRNVKGFFHIRPVSPASPISVIVSEVGPTSANYANRSRAGSDEAQPQNNPSLLHRWRKDSISRRSKTSHLALNRPPSIFEDEIVEKPYTIATMLRSTAPLVT